MHYTDILIYPTGVISAGFTQSHWTETKKKEMLEHHQHLTFSDFLSLNLAVSFLYGLLVHKMPGKYIKHTHTHNIDIMMINAHYKHAF